MSKDCARFRLQLLGVFGLFDLRGARIEISSRKSAALLALLATGRDGVRSRTWLQDMLWGSRGTQQAQASLRKELSTLRQVLNRGEEPLIEIGRDRVALNLALLDVDLSAPDAGSGTFLEGIDFRGENAFEDWLREQRGAQAEARRPASLFAPQGLSDSFEITRASVRASGARTRPAVAVMRFETSSPTEGESWLAGEVAEAIIDGLARSRMLSVGSRHSSLRLDPTDRDMREICEQLDVEYLVQGHVRRRGEGVIRVSVFLIDGARDRTVWSEYYDLAAAEVAERQDALASGIIGDLEATLLGHQETRSLTGSRHWDLLLRGRRNFWRATFADWAVAHRMLEQALALDPEDVPTLYHLALCHLGEVWGGAAADPRANIGEAHRLALKAVSNDPTDAYAHYVLGTVLSLLARLDQAEAEQRRALHLNPHLAAAHGELGRLCLFQGRLDEAVVHSDRAITTGSKDPHRFLWFRTKALAAFVQGHFDEAARHAADACASGPHQFFLHYLLAASYAAAGKSARAAAAIAEGKRLLPSYTEEMIRVAHPFAEPAHLARYLDALGLAGWSGSPASQPKRTDTGG